MSPIVHECIQSLTEEYLFVYLNYNLCEGGRIVVVVKFDLVKSMMDDDVREGRGRDRAERERE